MKQTLRDFLCPQPKSKIKAGDGQLKGAYNFYTSSQIQSKFYHSATYTQPALIFGTGGMASVHYCNEPFSTSTDCLVMYGRLGAPLELIYYYLRSNMHLLQDGFKGAGLQHISKDYILNININMPAPSLQEQITHQMRLIDAMINGKKQQILSFDEAVKSRFIEMFGDVMHNSKSWKVYSFAEISSSRLGKMLDAKQQTGKCSYPYLANFNVQWFSFNLENLNNMDFNEAERIEFELRNGDLLVCEGGEIGRCAVWHNEIKPCFFQKALHRVRCNRQLVHPYYLAWWFKYNCDHNGFEAIAGAKATIAHLPGVKLKQLQVAVPPIELQGQFAAFVEQVDKSKYYSSLSFRYCQAAANTYRQEWMTCRTSDF